MINAFTLFEWTGKFTDEWGTYPEYLTGWPFPDICFLYSGDSSGTFINWPNFILNQTIFWAIAFGIYFLLLRKINFESRIKKATITVIIIFIYLRFGLPLGFIQYFHMTNSAGGKWPDKIEVQTVRWHNPFEHRILIW